MSQSKSPTANLPEFSVTEISSALKRTVEDAFPYVRVRGEVSGLKAHSSGHVYFDLKDEKSVINAVIWKGSVRQLKVKPQSGLEVVCTGKISTYGGSSRYQLIVEQVELAGLGALMAMLEERKKMLAAEGLFAAERKKRLPYLPEVVGVITSPTGAVIRDIMHRLQDRFPRRVLLWPVAVQGEKAAAEVAAAVRGFNVFPRDGLPRPDVLIVARGGGSIEDLMAFNEEAVVRAVAESGIPVISAVGHETDTTLIDFASDVRAPTPTAAAEMAVPVRAELLAQNIDFERRLLRCFSVGMERRKDTLRHLSRALPRADQLFAQPRQRFDVAAERLSNALRRNLEAHRRHFIQAATLLRPQGLTNRLAQGNERLVVLSQRMGRAHKNRLGEAARKLESLTRILDSVSYRAVLARGFALVRGEDGSLKRQSAQIASGEALSLTFSDGSVSVVAGEGGKPPAKPRVSAKKSPGKQGDLF
ncbi:exodeoxyribonuclease VII large subunit [Rhizomicrobium palustre]|uniref:Exodeoxyribonuclease 7 large subunit n=1 Tax=Rhizomicrobium palustre TaxID=189966 RepID=A0A846N2I7_9PROT|nr:exodeoxyribonuclease VII large subunit [Rhizomicrobium palustre]NIK89310.1 exodeoxyribonuclease VII large subunit [Rhizomicrobium palustre]